MIEEIKYRDTLADKEVAEMPLGNYQENLSHIKRKLYACAQIDICICCDITGSMDRYIDSVKDSLFGLTLDFKNSSIIPRFAFLGYRDKIDKQQYEICDFTTELQKILVAIEHVACSGGGDSCEDCVSALIKASELSWRSKEKYLIWILDAPTHGNRYHESERGDDFPMDDNADINLEKVINYYSDSKISLVIFKCNNTVDRMMKIIKDNYKLYDLATTTHEFKGHLIQEIKAVFKQESSNSIKMVHKSISVDKKQQQMGQISSDIRWDSTIMEKRFKFEVNDGTLEYISFDKVNPGLKIIIEPRTTSVYNIGLSRISKGSFRNCYQLHDETGKYLAKIKITPYEASSLPKARCDLDATIVGNFFAGEFNKALNSGSLIQFLASMLLRVEKKDLDEKIFCKNQFFIAERFMAGQYVKYNNNNGWVNQAKSKTEVYEILQAFSHYTFQRSKGYLIIVDLQGSINDNKIMLTDPAIHTQGIFSSLFGNTNCGPLGISDFFLTHECNRYCEILKLDKVALSEHVKLADDSELYNDLTYKLGKMGEEKSASIPKGPSFANRTPDLGMYLKGLETFAEDELRVWLMNYIEYEEIKVLPPKPGKDRKVKIWLKNPSELNSILEKCKGGLQFNTGRALFRTPNIEESKSIRKARGGTYTYNRGNRGGAIHSSYRNPKKIGERQKLKKSERLGRPHFSLALYGEEIKENVVRTWLNSFCQPIDFDIVPDCEKFPEATKIEVWIKDYTKVDAILKNNEKLQFMGNEVKVFVEKGVSEPIIVNPKVDTGPPHICAVLGQYSPSETEIEQWVAKHFPYKKFELVSKVIDGFMHNTLKIWLNKPSSAQAIVGNYNSRLKFNMIEAELFLPSLSSGHGGRGYRSSRRGRRYYK